MSNDLPYWSTLFFDVCLLHTTSAAAERVNSVFNNVCGELQQTMNDINIETNVMLSYNHKK